MLKKLKAYICESLDGYVRIMNHIEAVRKTNSNKRPVVQQSTKLCKKLIQLKTFDVFTGPFPNTWEIVDYQKVYKQILEGDISIHNDL